MIQASQATPWGHLEYQPLSSAELSLPISNQSLRLPASRAEDNWFSQPNA